MTTRTTIYYGGQEYVVARGAAELKAEIGALLAQADAGWLVVNHGRGALREAELLITEGIPVALIDTSDPN